MDMFVNGLSMGALLVGVLVAAFSVFRVEEGHLGLLTAFKAVKRNGDGALRTFSPGLHVKLPWERAVQVNMMEQHLALPEDGGREAIAEDGTVLRLDASMRYTPALGGLHEYVFGMRHTSDHLTHLFTALMRNELANVRAPDAQRLGGSYALIRRDRKPLDLRIEAACKAQLDDRYGVKFRADRKSVV